jgi:hypothetical protein
MPHGSAQISPRGLKEEMVMIYHQAVPMNHESKSFMRFGKGIQKRLVIRLRMKDRLAPSATIHHMINGIFVFYADWSGHETIINESMS